MADEEGKTEGSRDRCGGIEIRDKDWEKDEREEESMAVDEEKKESVKK